MIAARSSVATAGIRAITPLSIVIALYLLTAGHNRPGGGFAAGLVLGAVVALRRIAGFPQRFDSRVVVGLGVVLTVVVALAPLLVGDSPLDQAVFSFELPGFGTVKTGSALPFDVGVTIVVVGLVAGVLDGLGGDEATEAEVRP